MSCNYGEYLSLGFTTLPTLVCTGFGVLKLTGINGLVYLAVSSESCCVQLCYIVMLVSCEFVCRKNKLCGRFLPK